MSDPLTLDLVRSFLSANGIGVKYLVEYKGGRSNHLGHVAVALYRLGDGQVPGKIKSLLFSTLCL